MWKDSLGLLLVVAGLVGLGMGVREISLRDYVAAALLLFAGWGTVRSGAHLLRPSVGE